MDNSNGKWRSLWQKQFPFGKPRCVVTTATCSVLATIVQDLPVGSLEPEWIVSLVHVFYRLHGRLFGPPLYHQVCDSTGRNAAVKDWEPAAAEGPPSAIPPTHMANVRPWVFLKRQLFPSVGLTKEPSLELFASQQGHTCRRVTAFPTHALPASMVKALSLVYLAVQLSGQLPQLFSPFKVKY